MSSQRLCQADQADLLRSFLALADVVLEADFETDFAAVLVEA
jgi:hypothetical protein